MLSKRTQYALRAVMYIASNQNNNKIGVNVIAKELAIPKQFLSKILQELVINGLLNSSKGKMGGFYLSNKNLKSNLRQIIEVFDGNSFFTGCVIGLAHCSAENPCALHAATAIYRMDIKKNLEVNSLKELAIQINEKRMSV